jgi:Ran GTPase-activating protein (RanGAP) involved in mRNA processing and transport
LESNNNLEDLNISDNFISDDSFFHLLEVLRRNKRLMKIDISKNQYTYKSLEKITTMLANNVEY